MNTLKNKNNLIDFKTKKTEVERKNKRQKINNTIKYINELINSIENSKKIGIITDEEARNQIQNMNKKLLNSVEELHKYKISQGQKDKRFYTYVYPPNGGPRKYIRKKTKQEVLEALVKFYSLETKCTLTTLYNEWIIKYAASHKPQTTKRAECTWRKFYMDTDMVNRDITKITTSELYDWACAIIEKYKLNSKQYNNMSMIIRQLYNLAVLKEIISINKYTSFVLERGLFYEGKVIKPEEQVFSQKERAMVEIYAMKDSEINNSGIPLAIILAFHTGLRVGELVALKSTDRYTTYKDGIVEYKINVQRQEIVDLEFCKETKTSKNRKPIIVNHPKGHHYRVVTLSFEANNLIDKIIEINKSNNFYDDDFLFINENGRVFTNYLDKRIRKYCKKCGITVRSMHKIRKTNITIMKDSNLYSDSYIQQHAGHHNIQTTLNHYIHNQYHDATDMSSLMSKALKVN